MNKNNSDNSRKPISYFFKKIRYISKGNLRDRRVRDAFVKKKPSFPYFNYVSEIICKYYYRVFKNEEYINNEIINYYKTYQSVYDDAVPFIFKPRSPLEGQNDNLVELSLNNSTKELEIKFLSSYQSHAYILARDNNVKFRDDMVELILKTTNIRGLNDDISFIHPFWEIIFGLPSWDLTTVAFFIGLLTISFWECEMGNCEIFEPRINEPSEDTVTEKVETEQLEQTSTPMLSSSEEHLNNYK
jgi:hypothetical protein